MRALLASELIFPAEFKASFRRTQKLVCTDGDKAVARAERYFQSVLAGPTLHTLCEIHRCYNIHKAAFEQVSSVLSVLKHIGLALNASDGMRSFRQTLRQVIARQLDYRPGTLPSLADFQRNSQVLNVFLPPRNPAARLKRAVIAMLANGDWREHGTLVHHCLGPQCCASKEQCVNKFCTLFVAAVAGNNPPIWPQARWLGAEAAIGWIGTLQAIHGLLSAAFVEWAQIAPVAVSQHVVGLLAPMLTDGCNHDHLGPGAEPAEPGEEAQDSGAQWLASKNHANAFVTTE